MDEASTGTTAEQKAHRRRALTEFELRRDPDASDQLIASRARCTSRSVRPVRSGSSGAGSRCRPPPSRTAPQAPSSRRFAGCRPPVPSLTPTQAQSSTWAEFSTPCGEIGPSQVHRRNRGTWGCLDKSLRPSRSALALAILGLTLVALAWSPGAAATGAGRPAAREHTTRITGSPGPISFQRRPRFSFDSPSGSVHFQCALGRGRWRPC